MQLKSDGKVTPTVETIDRIYVNNHYYDCYYYLCRLGDQLELLSDCNFSVSTADLIARRHLKWQLISFIA